MKTWNKILGALVLVLAAAVGFLSWKVYHPFEIRPDYQLAPPPPVPASIPAADREKINERFKQLQQAQKTFAEAQAARDQRLQAALAEAKKQGGGGDAARWQKALDDHRAQWMKYQQENQVWRKEVEQRADPASPETDLPPPPSPPLPTGPEPSGDSQKADEDFAALAGVAAATICIAEPPLCLIAPLLKGLLGEGREELLRLAGAVALGEGVDPSVVDAASKILRKDPNAREALLKIFAEKAREAGDDSPGLAEIKQRLGPILEEAADPRLRTMVGRILDLSNMDRPCEEILASLPDPERLADEEKQELELGLAARPAQDYDRLWKGCLAPHYATDSRSGDQP